MTIYVDDDYTYELPDDHAAAIIAGIPDDGTRQRVQDAVDATEEGEPTRLPVQLADVLLNAYSEWERKQEGG